MKNGGNLAFVHADNRTQTRLSLDHHRPGIAQKPGAFCQRKGVAVVHQVKAGTAGTLHIGVVRENTAVFF